MGEAVRTDYAEGRTYRAEAFAREGERIAAARLVRLLLAAAGVPFGGWLEQRQPTRKQCRTDALDWLASKEPAWLRVLGRHSLARFGLTLEQVAAWRAEQGVVVEGVRHG